MVSEDYIKALKAGKKEFAARTEGSGTTAVVSSPAYRACRRVATWSMLTPSFMV